MVDFLCGHVVTISHEFVIVNVGGFGFKVFVSMNTYNNLSENSDVTLYTYLHISKDSLSMYGFFSTQERDIFLKLISVSSVGPKTAMIILTTFTTSKLIDVIKSNDVDSLKNIKGVSKKTAQRIILELFNNIQLNEIQDSRGQTYDDAVDALVKLGFTRKTAQIKVEKVLRDNEISTVEDIVKMALS